MKFLVMSDNHGQYDLVKTIVSQWRNQVDYLFHTGDSEFPADDSIWSNFDGVVAGNMDFYPGYKQVDVVETSVGRVGLVHGHHHGVNYGLQGIAQLAEENQIRFMFYGHTHILYADIIGNVLFANPGSLSVSRGRRPEKTFMIVEMDKADGLIDVKYYDEQSVLIPDLKKTFKS